MSKRFGAIALGLCGVLGAGTGCSGDRPGFGMQTEGQTMPDAAVTGAPNSSDSTSQASPDPSLTSTNVQPVSSVSPLPTGSGSAACSECTAQQTQCANGIVETCSLVGECWVWGAPQACPEGVCKDALACTTCTDACSLGTTACTNGELSTCAEGPQGCLEWSSPQACATGQCGTASTCFECEEVCAVGEASCEDGQLTRCEQDALGCWGWGVAVLCESGACTTATACGECDDLCAVGDKSCEAGATSECVADAQGCLDWSEPEDCETGACGSDTECLVCDDECPSEGETQCDDGQEQTCVADDAGCLAWSEPEACEFVCNPDTGTCDGSCTPDDSRCDDAQPQVCNDDGEWEDEGEPCGQCTSCSMASGTCMPMAGGECDDDNACTEGEQCQANGTCGGGDPVTCDGADQCHTVGACVPATGCPAPVVKAGTCDTDNECIRAQMCQENGTCGGGVAEPITKMCGDEPGQYCDGEGGCGCRVPSSGNLLENPGFDGSASDWVLQGAVTYVADEDADGCDGSGSVLVDSLYEMPIQCLPGEELTEYHYGFHFRSSSAAGYGGTAICNIFFYDTDDCEGAYIGSGSATAEYTTNNWVSAQVVADSPEDTQSIRVNCVAAAAAGYYDQLYLSLDPPGAAPF